MCDRLPLPSWLIRAQRVDRIRRLTPSATRWRGQRRRMGQPGTILALTSMGRKALSLSEAQAEDAGYLGG